MSLAADVARTASNWNCALTLNWFIASLSAAKAQGRQGLSLDTALDMIHEHLSSLERQRLVMLNDERVKKEMAQSPQLAEVLS